MYYFTLKDDMKLGVSCPATQCEGGEIESSWVYWWRLGNIRDHASPAEAAQHWVHWETDSALLRALGVKVHRMGIDWTRVEPREEEFDAQALAHYRAELQALRETGIRVQLELHHFTDPVWFEEKGGFEREENLSCYLRYADQVASALGDLADEYLTFAEPNAYALGGYLGGSYPPGKNNPSACFRVLTNMAACHIQAYSRLHALHRAMGYADCRVSVSLRVNNFAAAEEENRLHRALAAAAGRSFDAAFHAFYLGRTMLPMKYSKYIRHGVYADFIAADWQGCTPVEAIRDTTPANCAPDLSPPDELVKALRRLHSIVALPLSVTLHAIDEDITVPYLCEHLRTLSQSTLPIEQCFYTDLTDGFEWLDGASRRCGLVHVDFDSHSRGVKDSFEFFARILRDGGVTRETYEEYFDD